MKKGFLLDREMLDFFDQLGDKQLADRILEKIKQTSSQRLITKSMVNKNINEIKGVFSSLGEDKKKIVERFFINLNLSVEVRKEKYIEEQKQDVEEIKESAANNLKIITPNIVPAKKLGVEDFIKTFRNRYKEIKSILQERRELQNLTSIANINKIKQNVSIIGIVTDKRTTKNKNILLEIEDLTGESRALINQNKPELYEKGKDILLDEIIGLRCSGSREMLFVNDVVWPDAAIHEKKKSDKEIYALFTSDLHVGSNRFLEENFLRFIDWLNGKLNHKEEVKKIKYLFITGDNVDGVGIFPGQEDFLDIKDIKEQYKRLAELLKKIREDIRIIICPGQHDAVRVAEPQPIIDDSYAPDIHKMKNITLVTNPAYVSLAEGFDILMYHGASFHGIIKDMEKLRLNGGHDKPSNVVKELLKRRHLAPSHSSTTYIPEERDPLLIRKIPDIITTGDLHKPDIDNYNNIMIISNSCWQERTPFEEKVGNHPDPCKVSMLNLKTRELKILDFS
jgi:DNA polymerase II small subunit